MLGNFAANVDPGDAKLVARTIVALHQHADGIATLFRVEDARTGTDPSLEFVTDHARAAADIAFFDRPAVSGIECMPCVLGFDVESVNVVEIAIPGLGDYRERPPVALHVGTAALDLPGDDCVSNHSDAVRVGDHHGTIEKSGVVDPGRAGHLSIAVECEPGGEHGVVAGFAARMNGCDSGANGTFANLKFAIPGD